MYQNSDAWVSKMIKFFRTSFKSLLAIALILMLGACSTGGAAGLEPFKSQDGRYGFLFTTGWTRVSVDNGPEVVYHDLINSDETLSLVISKLENEVDLDLPPRVSFANNTDADIFVSIHANASRGKRRDINGLETFYYRGWRGRLLAKRIQKQILRVSPGSPDRGVKQGRFYVIKNTRMPAVLVEIGFLTGRLDSRRLDLPTPF